MTETNDLPCVLFVEDDQTTRELVRMMSRAHGTFNIETADTASEAIARINHHRGCYDAVITDFELPDLTGAALALLVQQHNPHVPVAVLTAHQSDEIKAIIARGGAQYLDKSELMRCDKLIASIEHLIEGRCVGATGSAHVPLIPIRQVDSRAQIEVPAPLARAMRAALREEGR